MAFTYTQSYNLGALAANLGSMQTQLVTRCVEGTVQAVDSFTPRDHGHLTDWLKVNEIVPTWGGVVGHVGPLEGLDTDVSVVGQGFIAQFIQWYMVANPGAPTFKPPSPEYAWSYLTDDQKEQLYQQRLGGRFGGPLPPPKYMGAVNEGKVPPGTAAQMQNEHFVERIKAGVEGIVLDAIAEFRTKLA